MIIRPYIHLTSVLLWFALFCYGPAVAARQGSGAPPKPNILVIFTDDMRADQLQYMPLTMAMLANQGVRFEQGFVASPLCGPNRASLLGGQYVHRHNVPCNDQAASLFDDTQTIGTWLQAAGYRTGYFGKWLNGVNSTEIARWPYRAPGWTDWRVSVDPQHTYYNYQVIENGTIVRYGSTQADYKTTVIGHRAREFIAKTPANRPFLAVVAFNAPHAPHTPETLADQRIGSQAPFPLSPAFNEADVFDKPPYIRVLPPLSSTEQTAVKNRWKKQVATLQSADRQIEAIRWDLERTGRLDETIVIFTSDNGLLMGEHRLEEKKSCVYNPCVRVPMVVRMPGIAPRVDTTHLVSTLDIPATITALAGVTPPYPLPGSNLVPLLQNPMSPWRTDLLIELLQEDAGRPPFAAVRSRTEMYAEYLDGSRFREYYNLTLDPFQLVNRASDPLMKTRVQALATRLAQLRLE
jgi:N-acetylglucosamine-6-sulfatase